MICVEKKKIVCTYFSAVFKSELYWIDEIKKWTWLHSETAELLRAISINLLLIALWNFYTQWDVMSIVMFRVIFKLTPEHQATGAEPRRKKKDVASLNVRNVGT